MFTKTKIASALLAAGLFFGVTNLSLAADRHSHGEQTMVKAKLNAGQKWKGDKHLRKSMGAIRTSIHTRLGEIHENRLPSDEYKKLANEIQTQIDYMVENCHLPEAEDEQLHIILNPIFEGVSEMGSGKNERAGAVKVVKVYNAYGKYFEDSNWAPLGK